MLNVLCCWNRPGIEREKERGERERDRDRERGNVLSHVGWSVLAASKEEAKRDRGSNAQPFYVAWGR